MTAIENPILLERLRRDVEAMPPGALLPRDWLLDRLADDRPSPSLPTGPAPKVDLGVRDISRLFGKRPSTVRAWLERGDFPGAYKLQGKEWRVPEGGIDAFQDRQRTGAHAAQRGGTSGRLSDWRKVKRADTSRRSQSGPDAATKRSSRGNAED